MHFFLYNFSCKAKYLEGKMKHNENVCVKSGPNTKKKVCCCIYPMLCTVIPLKRTVEEFCVFQLLLPSLPNV